MNDKLTNAAMANLLAYCARLATMVSPKNARDYYGFTFDGAVGDTLSGLARLYENDGSLTTFMQDELYGPTLRQMLEDIDNYLSGGID